MVTTANSLTLLLPPVWLEKHWKLSGSPHSRHGPSQGEGWEPGTTPPPHFSAASLQQSGLQVQQRGWVFQCTEKLQGKRMMAVLLLNESGPDLPEGMLLLC